MISSALSTLLARPRWQITLGIVIIAQVLSAVGFSIIFPFLPLYVAELGTNTSLSIEFWAGMVFSAQGFTMMFAAPVWGALADRYGRKLMVERATFGAAILLFLMGYVNSAEELVLLRALQGMVAGTVSAANALIAGEAPRERTGFAMGAIQVGLWGGIALGPLIGGILSDAYGFRAPFILTAILLAFAGFLVMVGVRENFQPDEQEKAKRTGIIAAWRHILGAAGVKPVYIIRFMTGLTRTIIVPIAPLFIASLAIESDSQGTYTGLMVGASSAAASFSAVYLGRLGDRIGHRKILLGSAIFALITYIPQAFVNDAWQLIALQAATGLAMGGMIAAPSAMIAVYTQRGEEGTAYGLDNSIVAASRAVAPLISATIATWFGLRVTFLTAALLFGAITFITWRWLPQTLELEARAS